MMAEYDNLPPSKIVERFGDEIRAAIQEVADKTPEAASNVARSEAKNEARTTAVRWYIAAVVIALVVSTATTWLMLHYAPRSHSTDITYRGDNQVAVCSRDVNASTEDHPVYICHRPGARLP